MNARDFDHVPHEEIRRYSIQGLIYTDPDDTWTIIDFFSDENEAIARAELITRAGSSAIYRVYDNHEHRIVWPEKESQHERP